jgi:D-aminopeptidase
MGGGQTRLNAVFARQFGVPVMVVAGDAAVREEARFGSRSELHASQRTQ